MSRRSRHSSHDSSQFCSRRCLNFILPFNPDAPTTYELDTFLQMVSHSLQCKFSNCYLIGGSLNCRSIKEVVRHLHHGEALRRRCLCLMCRSFGKLYARHLSRCRMPLGHCPFTVCESLKRRLWEGEERRRALVRAATNATPNGPPAGENAPAQQPTIDLSQGIRQNANTDAPARALAEERAPQSSTSTSEMPREESNA